MSAAARRPSPPVEAQRVDSKTRIFLAAGLNPLAPGATADRGRGARDQNHKNAPTRVLPKHSPLARLTTHDGSLAHFGALRFPGVRVDAKYARISCQSDIGTVIELLQNTWGLPEPSYLISVTGAAGPLKDMSETDMEVFKQGLLKVVRRTDAWLISGGSSSGVMQLVGDAAYAATAMSSLVCLGIASWGVTYEHEKLERRRNGQVFEYLHRNSPDPKSRTCLDRNHTHYLLVDDGTEGKFGGEIGLRSNLEDALTADKKEKASSGKPGPKDSRDCRGSSSTATSRSASSRRPPTSSHIHANASVAKTRRLGGLKPMMILLVVGGGPGTLKTVLETLKKGRPVIVMLWSGGVANEIGYYFERERMRELAASEAREFDPSASMYLETANDATREKCIEMMPQIYELGSQGRVGKAAHVPGIENQMLTFFEERSEPGSGYVAREAAHFEQVVLQAMLFDCRNTTEAIFHAVCWSQPQMLQTYLASDQSFDSVGMSRALQVALCIGGRTASSLQCVQLLIASHVKLSLLRMPAICEVSGDLYGRMHQAAAASSSADDGGHGVSHQTTHIAIRYPHVRETRCSRDPVAPPAPPSPLSSLHLLPWHLRLRSAPPPASPRR